MLSLATAYGVDPTPFVWLAMCIGVAALVVKLGYWREIRDDSTALTLERAIGVREGVRPPGMSVAQARLFDVGHSHGTFLTNEFVFTLARQHATVIRCAALALALACSRNAGCFSPRRATRSGSTTAMRAPDPSQSA